MLRPRYVALLISGLVVDTAAYNHEAYQGIIRRASRTHWNVDGPQAHKNSNAENLVENLIEATAESLPQSTELHKDNLPVGVVIAISIALGLGITFLIGCITTATLAWTKVKSRKNSLQIST